MFRERFQSGLELTAFKKFDAFIASFNRGTSSGIFQKKIHKRKKCSVDIITDNADDLAIFATCRNAAIEMSKRRWDVNVKGHRRIQ
ncbi:hypothetical protein ROS1_57840 [Roseibium sp. ROS1]